MVKQITENVPLSTETHIGNNREICSGVDVWVQKYGGK